MDKLAFHQRKTLSPRTLVVPVDTPAALPHGMALADALDDMVLADALDAPDGMASVDGRDAPDGMALADALDDMVLADALDAPDGRACHDGFYHHDIFLEHSYDNDYLSVVDEVYSPYLPIL